MLSWIKGLFEKKKGGNKKDKGDKKDQKNPPTGKIWEVNEYGKYGKNAGSLDWTEVNCMLWIEERSRELFKSDTELLSCPQITLFTKGVASCEGDAVATNRKKKIGAIFEFAMVLNVTCVIEGSSEEFEGKIELPYVTDDATTVDDFGFELRMKNEKARKLFFAQSDKYTILQRKMDTLLKELQSGGPVRQVENVENFEKIKRQEDVRIHKDKLVKQKEAEKEEEAKRMKLYDLKPDSKTLYKSFGIQITGEFDMPKALVMDCFSNVEQIAAYTNSTCKVLDSETKTFSLFGGSVTGQYLVVDEDSVEMKWRQNEWTEGHESVVSITFVERGNSTEVTLQQVNVPVRDSTGGQVKMKLVSGWRHYFFERIKAISGSKAIAKGMFKPRGGFVNFHSPRFMFGQ